MIFRKNNFLILYKILSKEENVVYTSSVIDPKNSVFEKPYNKTSNTN